ncbi:MAG: malic enzyme-like NAD(P)-binding protein, partial [Promethearchaeota archaeon]
DLQDFDNYKHEIAQRTNPEQINGDLSKALEGTDVLISLSIPDPGIIKKEWISKMMDNAIVFACANPVPEIFPWDALEAGAKIVVTGRSDFPNQVNNSLGFPGIFRGTLDVRAAKITDEMCIAAANELANLTEVIYGTLKEDQILPTMEHKEIFINEAVAVGLKAIEQGIARVKLSKDELFTSAEKIINNSQTSTKLLMEKGLIQPFDDYIK